MESIYDLALSPHTLEHYLILKSNGSNLLDTGPHNLEPTTLEDYQKLLDESNEHLLLLNVIKYRYRVYKALHQSTYISPYRHSSDIYTSLLINILKTTRFIECCDYYVAHKQEIHKRYYDHTRFVKTYMDKIEELSK